MSHETELPHTRRRPVDARVLEPHPGFVRLRWCVFRGCRFAQPPATFLHPSGVDVPGSNGVRDGYANRNDGHRCVRMNANDGERRFDRIDGCDGRGTNRIHGDGGGATRRVAYRHAGASGARFRSWCPVGEVCRLETPGISETEPRVQSPNRNRPNTGNTSPHDNRVPSNRRRNRPRLPVSRTTAPEGHKTVAGG